MLLIFTKNKNHKYVSTVKKNRSRTEKHFFPDLLMAILLHRKIHTWLKSINYSHVQHRK